MNVKTRVEKLESRGTDGPSNIVVWYANPLDGEPEPKPEVGDDDILFEVWYTNPPPGGTDERESES